MAQSLQNEVARRIRQVRRRLWVCEFLGRLLASWTIAFSAGCVYFIIHAALWGRPSDNLGWTVFGVAAASGPVLGLIWALKRSPSLVGSALAIDERFALKERVTTCSSLSPQQRQSPAGQALLEDVHAKLAACNVKDSFPIRIRWPELLRPAVAGTLALLAFLYFPRIDFFVRGRTDEIANADTQEARKQLDELRKEASFKDRKDPQLSAREKEINDMIDKLLEKDIVEEKDRRESLEQVRALEEKIDKRINDLKDEALKNREAVGALEKLKMPKMPGLTKDLEDALAKGDLKKAGEEIDRFAREMMQEGLRKEFEDALNKGDLQKDEIDRLVKKLKDQLDPAAGLEDALTRGDMKKAAEELDRLQKKIQNNELSQRQLERLVERFEQLERELHRLHDLQDLRDELARQLDQEVDAGNLTEKERKELEEQLERELEGLKDELTDLKELDELVKELEKALQDRAKGMEDDADLKGKFGKLRLKLERLGKQDGARRELERLQARQEQLRAARLALLRSMRGNNGKGPGPGGTGQGSGARPKGAEPADATVKNERLKTDADLKKLRITGYASGGTFSKIPAKEVRGSFQRAQQEAAETSEIQRIPADVADISKGYFQNLGGQK